MKRRDFLASIGVGAGVVIAGCMGSSSGTQEFRPATAPWKDVEEQRGDGTTTLAGTAILPDGTFAVRRLSPDQPVIFHLDATVSSERTLDFLTMQRREFDRYRADEDYFYISDKSAVEAGNPSITEHMASGEYVHVFDNTGDGSSDSAESSETRVDFELSISHLDGGPPTPPAALSPADTPE